MLDAALGEVRREILKLGASFLPWQQRHARTRVRIQLFTRPRVLHELAGGVGRVVAVIWEGQVERTPSRAAFERLVTPFMFNALLPT